MADTHTDRLTPPHRFMHNTDQSPETMKETPRKVKRNNVKVVPRGSSGPKGTSMCIYIYS